MRTWSFGTRAHHNRTVASPSSAAGNCSQVDLCPSGPPMQLQRNGAWIGLLQFPIGTDCREESIVESGAPAIKDQVRPQVVRNILSTASPVVLSGVKILIATTVLGSLLRALLTHRPGASTILRSVNKVLLSALLGSSTKTQSRRLRQRAQSESIGSRMHTRMPEFLRLASTLRSPTD